MSGIVDTINNAQDNKLIASNVFPIGNWTHLVIVFTPSGGKKAYVNGKFVGEDASGYSPFYVAYGANFSMGSLPDGNNYLSGTMDDVSIWNRALNQTEIKQVCGSLCS